MTDKQKAIEAVMKFLSNETKQTLLVRGYDNEAKISVVLSCLNNVFSRGIIRTSSMSNIPDHINRAFNKNLLPTTVKSTTNYKIGNMTININSYATSTKSNPKGNEGNFTIFHPVQLVLDSAKRYDGFLRELDITQSKKVILITTNEWSIKKWDIENHVDEVFFYNVENDNPQLMSNLKSNGAI